MVSGSYPYIFLYLFKLQQRCLFKIRLYCSFYYKFEIKYLYRQSRKMDYLKYVEPNVDTTYTR